MRRVFIATVLNLLFLASSILMLGEAHSFQRPTEASRTLFLLLTALPLWIAARRFSLQAVIQWTLFLFAALVGLAAFLVHFQPEASFTQALIFLCANLVTFSLLSIFLWALLNQASTPREALRSYLPIVFLFFVTGSVITNLGLVIVQAIPSKLVGVSCALIFALPLVRWMRSTKLEGSEEAVHFSPLTAAYLLAACAITSKLLLVAFKSGVGSSLAIDAYAAFMGRYSLSFGIATFVISGLCALFGWLALTRKGWQKAALLGCAGATLGTLLAFASQGATIQGLSSAFLRASSIALFLPLVQILYMTLPARERFGAQIVTEMVALPIMSWGLTFLLFLAVPKMEGIAPYLKGASTIVVVGLWFVFARISRASTEPHSTALRSR